ncbi:MAG: hypothetical protein M3004_01115 [Bacteroidota bacterium]|nr:hypothetical protein [Bacteroidota bacterium]
MKNLKHLLFLFLILGAFSCKKESSDTAKTTLQLLENKKWQISAISGTQNGVYYADMFSSQPDYAKDDYYYFQDTFVWELNDNAVKQPGNVSPILDRGTWHLSVDNTNQSILLSSNTPKTNGIDFAQFRIVSITDTALVVENNDTQSGDISTYSFTAIK